WGILSRELGNATGINPRKQPYIHVKGLEQWSAANFILRCGPARDHSLLVTQSDHGIHAHGTARWDVTGQHRHHRQYGRNGKKSCGLALRTSIERPRKARQQSRENERGRPPDRQAGKNQPKSLSNYQPKNILLLGP